MAKCFGVWIRGTGVEYFISKPDQALPQHVAIATAAFKLAARTDKALLHNANGVSITAARTYADVAKFVVLEDAAPKEIDLGIFRTMWTPESPNDLECDFDGKKRFKVLDFAVDAAEADTVVKLLRQQKGRV